MASTEPKHGVEAPGTASRFFDTLGVGRPANTFERNNAVAVFLMGALPAVAGSAISFILGISFVWALISRARGHYEFRLTRSDRLLAWTFTIFVILVLATGLLAAENRSDVFLHTIWLLPYLSLWVIIPRLRASPRLDYLRLYVLGAAVGCIGALVFASTQVFGFDLRAKGGAGNAAVFGIMALCLAGIAGLAIDFAKRRHRLLAGAGVIAGFVAVILSLTRGVVMAIPLIMILLLVYAPRRWGAIALRPASLLFLATAGLVLFAAWDLINNRIGETVWELSRILEGGHTSSMGERIRQWQAGLAAFADSPLWGYGIQNRMDALVPYLTEAELASHQFSHPHNAFLAFAIDGGVILLVSLLALLVMPVVIAWRAPRHDGNYRLRLFLALIVTVSYAAAGQTQIMLKHDIMDSFYIFTAIVIAASVPARWQRREQG